MFKYFHLTFYWTCDYLPMLGLNLIHASKSGPCYYHHNKTKRNNTMSMFHGIYSWWRHQMDLFPRYWPFVRGSHRSHRSPVNYPRKKQWSGALMFSLIYARINGWVNNRVAGDLRRHRAHYDVIAICKMPTETSELSWLCPFCRHCRQRRLFYAIAYVYLGRSWKDWR